MHQALTLTICDNVSRINLEVFARKAVSVDSEALVRFRRREANAAGEQSKNNGKVQPPSVIQSRVWTKTPFGPLACRIMNMFAEPDDAIVRADALIRALENASAQPKDRDTSTALSAAASNASNKPSNTAAERTDETNWPVTIEPGPSAAPSWQGFLPVEAGWETVSVIPAQALRELEQKARVVASDNSGPLGLPKSLLDQTVMEVTPNAATAAATYPMQQTPEIQPAGLAMEQPKNRDTELKVRVTTRDIFALCSMGFVPKEPLKTEPVRVSRKGRWHRLDGRFGSIFTQESLAIFEL